MLLRKAGRLVLYRVRHCGSVEETVRFFHIFVPAKARELPKQANPPMPIYTKCPSCQSALSVGEHFQDKKIRCKKCSYVFTIEEALVSLSKQDEAEIEGADAQLQIQQTPQLPSP